MQGASISRKLSMRAQQIASVPIDEFDGALKDSHDESSDVQNREKNAEKNIQHEYSDMQNTEENAQENIHDETFDDFDRVLNDAELFCRLRACNIACSTN
jgi:hypothetical protein